MDIPSGNIQKAIEHGPFIVDLYIPIKVVIFHNQLCQSTRGYIINQSVEDIYKQLYTLLIEGQLYTSINLQVKTRDRIYIYIPIKPFKQFIYTIYQSAIPPIPVFFCRKFAKELAMPWTQPLHTMPLPTRLPFSSPKWRAQSCQEMEPSVACQDMYP